MTGHASDVAMIIRYVQQWRVKDYEALGWIYRPGFIGTHHGEYSAIMEWPLWKGEPVEPPETIDKKETVEAPAQKLAHRMSFLRRMFGWWF